MMSLQIKIVTRVDKVRSFSLIKVSFFYIYEQLLYIRVITLMRTYFPLYNSIKIMIGEENEHKISHNLRKTNGGELNATEFWQQLNTFRSNPQLLYSLISSRKNHYNKQGLFFSLFHPNKSIKTKEGRQPINSLLQETVNVKNLPFIDQNQELNLAADALARQFKSCQLSNSRFQPNYKQIRGMLNQSTKYSFPCKIKCAVGVGFSNCYEPLISLLIDDDNISRQNRKLFLSREYNYCGIGAVALQDQSLICAVYLFTEYIIEKSTEQRI